MFIKKFFSVMLLLAVLALPQIVFAEKTDWYDRGFNFHSIRTLIVFDPTATPGVNVGSIIDPRSMQTTFLDCSRKLKCRVITEAEARNMLSYQIGINLNAMAFEQARHIIIDNAYRIADGWVLGNIDIVANNTYVEPARTVWEQKKETRTYRDSWGNRHEETYYVQVPVTYPPQRVDVSTIQMTLKVYESRRGAEIFSRRDVRDRQDYMAQKGMYGRICNSFFEDVGNKIR